MRLAYVCADRGVPLLGFKGASVHMREMAAALAARGNHVVLACARLAEGNRPPAVDAVVSLPHNCDEHEDYLAALLQRHEVDAVLERYSLNSGPARRATARMGIPLALEINAPLALEASRYRGLRNLDEALVNEELCIRDADAVVTVSRPLAAYVRKYSPKGPVAIVPNAVDPRLFAGRKPASLPVPAWSVCVGFVGSMKPWHGIAELIEAFRCVAADRPSAHLVFAGTGPEEARLERAARSRELRGRIHALGPIPHEAVPAVLAALSIAVAPYPSLPDFYFSPIKLVEYMAAGLPVVFSDVGDLRQLVNGAGIAYPPGDVPALANAIARLIEEPGLRRTMGAVARARSQACSWDHAAAQVESLLRSAAPVPVGGG